MKTQTKAQALAQGITLRRWRNMRYRTARGQQCLAAYRRNADRASKIHKNRHRDFSVIQPEPITPALARILNYAPINLAVPENVHVQYIDPVIHLQRMTYYL